MNNTTVKYVRRLPPYSLFSVGSPNDEYVSDIFKQCLEPETLSALHEYTRGMYSIDSHYKSLMFFNRDISDDHMTSRLCNHPSLPYALAKVREELSCLRGTVPISTSNIDKVYWIPSSAAGYGYVGPKKDNYHLARRNATRALFGYDRWRDQYRFVPDKAYARNQLALRATPKIRHVWGRAFHHFLIEGLIGRPLLERLVQHDTPIYIGRDIHKDMPAVTLAATTQGGTCYCIDFSKFDSSVCSFLVHTAWTILLECLLLATPLERLVFDFRYALFTNTPLVMPDGRLYIVLSTGVPSGSYFTQII